MPAFKDRDIVSFYFDGEKKTGEILDIATTGFFSFFFVKKKELNSKNVSTNNFYNFCIINMKNIFGFINTED